MDKTDTEKSVNPIELGFAILAMLSVFLTIAVTCNWINGLQ